MTIKKTSSQQDPIRKTNPKQRKTSFPIVCIGGSAGSFQSLEKFFMHMSSDSGLAFVIVMHLDPNHKGQLTEVIQKFTPMPVTEAADGMSVLADTVYLIPPNKDMGIHNRKLLLLPPSKPHGFRQPIDHFLQSLADDQWNKAVAIILSGMGSDGETGVRMIKEKLGMVMVEDPASARYNSMPLASIETNLVDYVLSPDEMPIRLIQYLNHPILSEEASDQTRSEIINSHAVEKILMVIRSSTGHDFNLYKKSTITRRIDRRVAFHQLPDYDAYVNHLRENPQEIDVLFNELLIGVTKFFRDELAFEALKTHLQARIALKKTDEPIRVWVAGCSTGEEAYSLGMIIMETLDNFPRGRAPKVQIFATDLDAEAIESARAGEYRENIAAYISPARLERFFTKRAAGYAVKKDLREMIVFAQHNLFKDAPFTRLDLLSCRNVMIYLTTELQKKIIPIFNYSIKPGGLMFLGPAESVGGFADMFVSVDPKWKIFERKDGQEQQQLADFPFHISKQNAKSKSQEESVPAITKTTEDNFNKVLLENFAPASILINERGEILYSNGKTGKYLELAPGHATMNIHKMAKEDLRYVFGNIIHQARSKSGIVEIKAVRFREDKHHRIIDLKACLLEESNLKGLILLTIEDKGLQKKNTRSVKPADENKIVEELEKELVYTKQQLSTTIEQMETSMEELKSTNEELQSTNEELQSTNEESLTTKEEMQSLNEELMTVNVQYQAKAEELGQLNNDMKNLLDATEIGTIFLDNNMEILRFTPSVKKLFNLIPGDVGRPIMHIASNFDYPSIENDIRDVIETLAPKEKDVETKKGEWYTLRIIPYRTIDNFISGAVLTFTLISNYKRLEYRLKALQKYASGVVNEMTEAALLIDKDLTVMTTNQNFLRLFNVKEQTIKNNSFLDFITDHWHIATLNEKLIRCREKGKKISQKFKLAGRTDRSFELSASPFIDENAKEILLIMIVIKEL